MKEAARSRTRNMILCALFAALIAVGAFLRIPVPAVPFTMQTFFVLLAGLLLGRRLGALSALIYLLLGLMGLPVFTNGGGFGYVLQPSFGYLIGFVFGAFVSGLISHRRAAPTFSRLLAAAAAGLGIIYLCGMAYYYLLSLLYLHNPIGLWPLFLYFFLIFVPGDGAMCLVAALAAKRLLPALRHTGV